MKEPAILICAPADAPMTVPGTIFNRFCATCGERVMIAPSGQRILREYPDATIQCGPCFETKPDPEITTVEIAAGNLEEALREAAAAHPNLRRNRN